MFYFKQMVNIVRANGIHLMLPEDMPQAKRNELNKEAKEVFFKAVERANIFVFPPSKNKTETDSIKSDDAEFDAPFDVFSCERLGGPLSDLTKEGLITDSIESTEMKLECTLSIEDSPRKFTTFVMISGMNPKFNLFGRSVFLLSKINTAVAWYVQHINNQELGTQVVKERIKVGSGSEKKIHTIRRIIYVKSKRESSESAFPGKNIDWSHRFLRRGHWRNAPGKLGKNRAGDYCVPNQTWVMEHEVGDKNLPLIKKTRLVIDTNE